MKKTICMALSVLVLVAGLPFAAHAADLIDSGYIGLEGDGNSILKWELDASGTLTISGNGETITGAMPGTANVTVILDGTTLAAETIVTVGLLETADLTLGDVDGNGKVESADARLALRASVRLEDYRPGTAEFITADVDKNGAIGSDDARTILRVSVKLESF